MSILIGIKSTHAGGCFHGAEGFEGISMDGTIIKVLKEGTVEELTHFVKEEKKKREKADKALYELDEIMEELSEKEYDRQYEEIMKNRGMDKYDQLLIIQGMILNL